MAFTVQLPTFQVETEKGNHLYSDYQQAYSKYVDYEKNNVPCELYKEGVKAKGGLNLLTRIYYDR